jgi:hypothetical protein
MIAERDSQPIASRHHGDVALGGTSIVIKPLSKRDSTAVWWKVPDQRGVCPLREGLK